MPFDRERDATLQQEQRAVFRQGNTRTHRSLCLSGTEGGMKRTESHPRSTGVSRLLFYIQSEQVSLVASSENEIERSPRARIVPSGLYGRERPEMFVAIIICLRGHRYKRGSARTSSSSYFSSSFAPQIVFFLSCDLAVLSLDFSTSISYLPGTSLVPYLLAFRRTCAELSGCVCATVPGRRRKTKEILEQIGSPRGQTGEGHEDSERTCLEAYASEARDKQERDKELVLRIGSVT